MNYALYQSGTDLLAPWQGLAHGLAPLLRPLHPLQPGAALLRRASAALEVLSELRVTHKRPAFNLAPVRMGNALAEIGEEEVFATPFGRLLHFRKDSHLPQPRVLVVAPMSGHFATLLRGTVQVLLQDHDVYITDWANARDVPLEAGRFDLDDCIGHIIRFLEEMGGEERAPTHVLAVCQPAVPVLAAVSVMAQTRNRHQPRSMTLMAGPIDTRLNPTEVNRLAQSKPIEWFERELIDTVPWRFAGHGRRVYPGVTQLSAFMSMNLHRHARAFATQYENVAAGALAASEAHRRFYKEYFAVMDLTAEFYLQTVRSAFQENELPRGTMHWRGKRVRPEAIRRTALLTVEGENDDICGIGQTMAALDLCSGIPVTMKRHHLQTGVGHYGVFNGRRWANEIYPVVREMIQTTS
ncbi:MAG: polyhydroxyalkanoate depolymerase [Azospirillum brasilense]|nr:MAG: polyhydroxyalkanoate depolymerase [Azospirillum brasilense]